MRKSNKNSLSGLNREEIQCKVEAYLRRLKKQPPKGSSVAPWAGLTSEEPPSVKSQWQRPVSVDDEDECTICFDRLSSQPNVTPLECGHVFHSKCIDQWLQTKSDCPICRKFALSKGDYPSLAV